MKQFKYDVYKLLEAVKNRPCLWNKNVENYKDRVERKMAWVEIFNILDDQYEAMSLDEKQFTSDIVVAKWTNIRDTFMKTIRKKGKSKKYVLYNHLKFLLATQETTQEQEQDSLGYTEEQLPLKEEAQIETRYQQSMNYEIHYEDTNTHSSSDIEVTPKEPSRKRAKKDSCYEDNPNIDFVSVDDPRIMNEDEAFFASLLPTVVKYDEDERLEFRIEVLALMKRIKDKRKWSGEALGP